MEDKHLLILRLEGALQSWDDISKWDSRGTGDFPTKTGIIGLLGCALGFGRNDRELVSLNESMTMAVRADRPGEVFTDFQTVTGYPLLNAEGKPKSTGSTIISRRSYLQDACFTVVLELKGDWHKRVVKALKEPKWTPYLGRKTCVPSRPILECEEPEYSNIDDALHRYPSAERAIYPMEFETEERHDTLASITRIDNLVGINRVYARRQVWRGLVKEAADVSVKS